MLPEVISHGVNGFLSNDPAELREYCRLLLNDKELAKEMGKEARKTIENRFSLSSFVSNWDSLFVEVANTTYEC
jgi:glycosyltransferase involved in cell wall biosynthesis